jgi:hypothetical protein
MGFEEIGVKLVVDGQASFSSALSNALKSFEGVDDALQSLIKTEKRHADENTAETIFKKMTAAEKEAYLATRQLEAEEDRLNDTINTASEVTKRSALSLTDLKSGFDLAGRGIQMMEQAYSATIAKTQEYEDQVRDLSRVSGASAEDTSRLIQTADDLFVSYDSLTSITKKFREQGLTLTTEELAKAADKYVALQTQEEKNTYAESVLGKTWQENTKLLEVGGAALRKMAASQDDNLVLTQKQIDQGLELKKAQDALADSVSGVTYAVSIELIPQLTGLVNITNKLINIKSATWFKDLADSINEYAIKQRYGQAVLDMYIKTVKNANLSMEDYQAAADRVAESASHVTKETAASIPVFEDTWIAASKTAAGFDEFASSLGATSMNIGAMKKEFEAARSTMLSGAIAIYNSNSAWIAKQYDLNKAVQETETKIGELSKLKVLNPSELTSLNKYWSALELANKSLDDMKNMSAKSLPAAMATMNNSISKIIDGPASFRSAATAVSWLQEKVDGLSGGTYLTPKQQEELTKLQVELGKEKDAIYEAQQAHQKETDSMIFNMLLQKAASDGLTQVEFDNLMKIGGAWGILDEKSATTASNLNKIDLNNAHLQLSSVYDVLRGIMSTPDTKTVTVTTIHRTIVYNENGDPTSPVPGTEGNGGGANKGKFASGGSFVIPQGFGYEGFNLGGIATASGGEVVTITPKNVSAGPASVTYNYSTNYNLNLATTQSMQTVQQSFAMMKLLAG